MGEDTTGMQATLDETPQVMAPLSERHTRIAAGMALVRDGMPVLQAAKRVDIPTTTLWRYCSGFSDLGNERKLKDAEDAILAASVSLSLMASERLADRVQDHDNPMKDADLAKVYGISTDKVAVKRNWAKGVGNASDRTQDALGDILDRLRRGDKVAFERSDPANEATDITPTISTDE